MRTESLNPEWRNILVCPACRAKMIFPSDPDHEIQCGGCDLFYPVEDGIPIMLIDRARAG